MDASIDNSDSRAQRLKTATGETHERLDARYRDTRPDSLRVIAGAKTTFARVHDLVDARA